MLTHDVTHPAHHRNRKGVPLRSPYNSRLAGHCLEIAVGVHQFDRSVKEAAEALTGEDLGLLPTRYHLTPFQENDTRNFRWNLMYVVSNKDNGLSGPHQAAHYIQVLKAGFQIETAGRLVLVLALQGR